MTSPLSPTQRSTPRRLSDRARSDREALHAVLDTALLAHLAVVIDGIPLALPTVFAYDPDGPDQDGTLYVHGSVASRSLVEGPGQDVSVTVMVLDGLVLARSGFEHSMNYRSAIVIGRPRVVIDDDELTRALDLLVDHVVPGRSATLRRPTRKERAATVVLALSLREASVKTRAGEPEDDPRDVAAGVWAGVLPLRLTGSEPVTATDAAAVPVPPDVARRAADLA